MDYAHAGPAFTTWHRALNLWLEWEIQGFLQNMGRLDYHTFRLPYWDWRRELFTSSSIGPEEIFVENRLGATRNVSGFARVFGSIYEDGWDTICWLIRGDICDPNVSTGPLQRCPFTGTDPCSNSNPDWPTLQEVNNAMMIGSYDHPPYNFFTPFGYRSFVDNKIGSDFDECRNDRMCTCRPFGGPFCTVMDELTFTSQMHTTVSLVATQRHSPSLTLCT